MPRPLQLPDEATSDAIVTRVSPQGPHKPASPPWKHSPNYAPDANAAPAPCREKRQPPSPIPPTLDSTYILTRTLHPNSQTARHGHCAILSIECLYIHGHCYQGYPGQRLVRGNTCTPSSYNHYIFHFAKCPNFGALLRGRRCNDLSKD